MKNNLTTHVTYILDESGSMQDIKPSVISGFNEYIKSLQNQQGKFLFTLTKFDSRGIRTPYTLLNIHDVKPLNNETYSPGEMTPLFDAVVDTVESIADRIKDNEPSLVVIMTDGLENASKKHNADCLKDLIHKLQHKGNWTFVFMGANQDSWQMATKIGISAGNVANWQATAQGTNQYFRGLAQDTAMYAVSMADSAEKGASLNVSNFVQKTGEDSHE